MKPKFGIIGCGNIARFHFHGLQKAGGEIVHLADLNPDAAKPYVEACGARFSTDYRAVIADPEVTAVSVLTGSKYHREICLAAVAAGKDVICEKTMMNNVEEAEEVAKAVLKSGQLFFTAFMKRFFPAVRKAQELLPSLGRLFGVQVRTYQQWGNPYEIENAATFEWALKNYGGAVLKCAGSHMLDLILSFLGRPQSLYAHIDYLPHSRADRKVAALLEYPDGLVVNFEAAAHPLKRIGYERNSWDEFLQINGVNGRLEIYTVMWDHPENNGALLVHYDNAQETATEYRFPPVNPFDVEMAYFHDCLEHRQQGHPDVIDGFNVDALIAAMQEAAAKKMAVTIDWRGL